MGKDETQITTSHPAEKKWNVLSRFNSLNTLLDDLLVIRGIKNSGEFLNPPKTINLLKDFDQHFRRTLLNAKQIILDNIKSKTPIVIFGDYDADGVCAVSILLNTIKKEMKYDNCSYFIPNRFDHGYGLSIKALDSILEKYQGQKVLFITVDTGITAVDEVAHIKKQGHTVIITDHHQKPDTLPSADEIVWSDRVVGSTLAWMLSMVLGSRNSDFLALAALATVTDLQDLLGFNRSLVKEGLEILNATPPLGIKKLLEFSGRKEGEITAYDLGFVIGPRLNASGRLEDASVSLKLLIEDAPELVEKSAQVLQDVNSQRQDKTLEMYEIAENLPDGILPRVIISSHADYHEGIIGLVAGRLVQKYYRPAIVMSLTDENARGSVRSIAGIDIISVLRKFEKLFINLGGHPMAAGFTIPVKNIDEFKSALADYFEKTFDDSYFVPGVDIDMELPITAVTTDLLDELHKLKPFGNGNREPVFCSMNVALIGTSKVGKDNKHLILKLYDKGQYFKGIYFNAGNDFDYLEAGDKLDLVYTIKENIFNGKRNVDLIVQEVRKTQ